MKIEPIKLNNVQTIPALGLGTWQSEQGKVGKAVGQALKNGYRHIDCASIYGNEEEIGETFNALFSKEKIKREDVFITSKLWNTQHHPKKVEEACKKTISDLQLDYLDLYLIHWGIAFQPGGKLEPKDENGVVITQQVPIQQTWQVMESLVHRGLVKSIGISNFTVAMLNDLFTYARIKPTVNQVEIHPYNSQPELVEYCKRMEVVVTAYSPLGSAGDAKDKPLSDKVVVAIAKSHKKSPAQILIRWAIQRELAVIPKSVTPERIIENFDVFDFELSDEDMTKINKLNKNQRFVNPVDWWGIPYFN